MLSKRADGELERYLELTPGSRALWEQAKAYLPGGDSRNAVFWGPYPLFIERGEGCRVWDADGVERIDFINTMTALILGHAPAPVVEAVREQAGRGFSYNGPGQYQVRLAQLLCERVPSLEMVRFTNSGTEATMNALRAARAFTGRSRFAKCEGGYHGTHDAVEVSVRSNPSLGGDVWHPQPVAGAAGLAAGTAEQVVVLPFNETEAARRILEEHADELAAVIVEPVLGGSGMIPAEPEYLSMLREFTEEHGVVLIFDEVISFRVAPGGAQEYYGVTPDMTTLGKVIGGGLPVGAFGGRREIMELYDPTDGPKIEHSGTFNANPMTMLAGVVTLEQLTPESYRRLAALTERLQEGVRQVCLDLEVRAQVTGLGSLFGVHFTKEPVRSYREAYVVDKDLRQRVFWGLMNEGILPAPALVGALSTATGEAEVDAYVDAFRRVLGRNQG